jgi:hypothetical protein
MFWKKPRRKRNRRGLGRAVSWPVFLIACFLLCAPLHAVDRLKELQDRFDKEPHAANKVKILDKLAVAQFEAASQAGASGNYVAVGFTLEKYRDNVRDAFALLKKQEPDADRHSNGYRQLELQVRRGIREL